MARLKDLAYKSLMLLSTPMVRYLVPESGHTISIFMLHGIYPDNTGQPVSSSSKSLASLKEGLNAIRGRYHIITMEEAVACIRGEASMPEHGVVITFDDSLKCLAEIVAPTLAKLGIPATFYLSTNVLDTGEHYWWHRLEYAVHYARKSHCKIQVNGQDFDLHAGQNNLTGLKSALRQVDKTRQNVVVSQIEDSLGADITHLKHPFPCAVPMTWDDAQSLVEKGMVVGSHGVSHSNFNLLTDEALKVETEHSRQRIQARLGISCNHFCYPYGIWSSEGRNAVIQAGYHSAVTAGTPARNGVQADPYALKRFSMPPNAWKAPYQVSGQHDLVTRMSRFKGFYHSANRQD